MLKPNIVWSLSEKNVHWKVNINFLVNLVNIVIKSINYINYFECSFKFKFNVRYSNISSST